MNHFYQGIKGWFHWHEVYRQAVRTCRDGGIIVEIGCLRGRSTAFLAVEAINSGKNIRIYAVDLWDESVVPGVGVHEFEGNLGNIKNVIMLREDSTKAAANFRDESLDFVWIDGDHHYPKPRMDIMAWRPKIRIGGWMGGDDLHLKGVHDSVMESFGPECSMDNPDGNWIRYQEFSRGISIQGSSVKPDPKGVIWWARTKSGSVDW